MTHHPSTPRLGRLGLTLALGLGAGLFSATGALAKGPCEAQDAYTILIHGGTSRAGRDHTARLSFQLKILAEHRTRLQAGAKALDTVEQLIRAMEDSGLFNAGKASIANSAKFIETDASIMDGSTMDAGSVASMRLLKNPITAARMVMEQTRHVMMVGDRGEAAMVSLGADMVSPDYFINAAPIDPETEKHGTVGAVVLDRCGNLAAGTSTGGYGAKIPGRVGDAPIIGAGTFAQNGVAAISATGHGEYFIRFGAARDIAARVAHGGQDLKAAAAAVIATMAKAGGEQDGRGGVIAVAADGSIAMPHSTAGMIRSMTSHTILPKAYVYSNEPALTLDLETGAMQ